MLSYLVSRAVVQVLLAIMLPYTKNDCCSCWHVVKGHAVYNASLCCIQNDRRRIEYSLLCKLPGTTCVTRVNEACYSPTGVPSSEQILPWGSVAQSRQHWFIDLWGTPLRNCHLYWPHYRPSNHPINLVSVGLRGTSLATHVMIWYQYWQAFEPTKVSSADLTIVLP